jgi:hypothetical protein
VRQQIRKAHKGFPLRRGARESAIETSVEYEVLSRVIVYSPQIADRIASEKRLSEMPDLPGNTEAIDQSV